MASHSYFPTAGDSKEQQHKDYGLVRWVGHLLPQKEIWLQI